MDDWQLVWATSRRGAWVRALTGPSSGPVVPVSLLLEPLLREYLIGGAIEVGAAGTRVRAGRRVIESSLLDRAWLDAEGGDRTRGLGMVVESTTARFGFRVRLHGDVEPLIDEVDSRLLHALLINTSIVMPSTDEGSTPSLAKNRFPSNLTRAEALALVTNPPGPDDPLPASW